MLIRSLPWIVAGCVLARVLWPDSSEPPAVVEKPQVTPAPAPKAASPRQVKLGERRVFEEWLASDAVDAEGLTAMLEVEDAIVREKAMARIAEDPTLCADNENVLRVIARELGKSEAAGRAVRALWDRPEMGTVVLVALGMGELAPDVVLPLVEEMVRAGKAVPSPRRVIERMPDERALAALLEVELIAGDDSDVPFRIRTLYGKDAKLRTLAALIVLKDPALHARRRDAVTQLQATIHVSSAQDLDRLLKHMDGARELREALVERFNETPTTELAAVLERAGGLDAKRALRDIPRTAYAR